MGRSGLSAGVMTSPDDQRPGLSRTREGDQQALCANIWFGRSVGPLLLVGCVVGVAVANYMTLGVHGASAAAGGLSTEVKVMAFNQWVNSFFFRGSFMHYCADKLGKDASHYLLTYLRDLLSGTVLYYLTAGLWHLYIYNYRGEDFFTKLGYEMPSRETIVDQIQLAQASMFLYAALPVFSEWLIEKGWTLCYYDVEEVGGVVGYLLLTCFYFFLVELGVYWMHRTLHENKYLYKYVHALHHKYNKPSTLSPWASVAFNPIDGILQASPYVVCLFLVPCHYLTHMAMVFFTAVWATNIHDAMDGNSEPIMGSKYHTVHHTLYRYNYGQIFTTMDYVFGTLRVPEPRNGKKLE